MSGKVGYCLLLALNVVVPMAEAVQSYSPSAEVKAAHNIPRFSTSGSIDKQEFNFTGFGEITGKAGVDYFTSVSTLPVVLIGLGIIALFFYNLLICCRLCFTCLKCAPTEEDINEHPEKVVQARNRVLFFFLFFMLLCVLSDHLLYYGNASLDKGADDIISGGDKLNDIFYDLSASLTYASKNSTLVQNKFTGTSGDCLDTLGSTDAAIETASDSLSAGLASLATATGSLSDMIDTLPPQVDNMKDAVETYMKGYKTIALFGCYAVVMAFIFIYAVAVFFQFTPLLIFIVLASEGVVTVLTLLCGVLMIIVSILADICMAPTEKLANLVPGAALGDTIRYMGTCEGTNPYTSPINDAVSAVSQITNAIEDIRDLCQDAADNSGGVYTWNAEYAEWNIAGNNSIAIEDSIDKLNSDIDCLALNAVYDKLIQDAFCTNLFAGLYQFWVTEYLVSGTLFFLMIMASVICMYFGTAWKLKKTDAHSHADAKDGSMEAVAYEGVDGELDGDEAGYKEEYDFTPAGPGGSKALTHSKLDESEVEMI